MLIPFLPGVLPGKVGITEVEVVMVEVKRIVKYTCMFIMMCCVFRREMMIVMIRMFRLMMKKGVGMMNNWNMKRMMIIYYWTMMMMMITRTRIWMKMKRILSN